LFFALIGSLELTLTIPLRGEMLNRVGKMGGGVIKGGNKGEK